MTYKFRNTDLSFGGHLSQVCLAHHTVTMTGHGVYDLSSGLSRSVNEYTLDEKFYLIHKVAYSVYKRIVRRIRRSVLFITDSYKVTINTQNLSKYRAHIHI